MEAHFLNILSAEDDLDDQYFIEKAVEASGIEASVKFVSDGKSLLEKLAELFGDALPDILLLDLNMPVMDGLAVLKVLREREDIYDLPIIILTTSSDRRHIDQCYSLGADFFFTKPDSFTELVKIFKSLPDLKNKYYFREFSSSE
jgi:two-component system response regulator